MKKVFIRILISVGVLTLLFLAPQIVLILRFANDIHTNFESIPTHEYGIVFGARVNKDTQLSDAARERIEAAVLLYKQGKIKKLFISGDNRNNAEADAIAHYAVQRGVPEADILIDRFGIDTNDTCRHFAAIGNEAIIITQGFHLPRTLLMCERSRIQSTGLAVENLGILQSRGDNWFKIYQIRIFRFFREAFLTWLYLLGLYDFNSNEAEKLGH